MSVPVLYPKVSLEEVTGRISRWLVAEGDEVTAGQVLFEIENDKAAVEVEAPAAGIIAARVPEGKTVDVGATVALILAEGESLPPSAGVPAAAPVAAAAPAQAQAQPLSVAAGERGPNPTPLARRLARENGLSLEGVSGSGPRGRVQRKDVLALMGQAAAAPQPAIAAPVVAPVLARPVQPAVQSPGAGAPLNARWLRQGRGPALVLIHGFSADLNSWRGFLAAARPEAQVLALDLPCHGGSHRSCPADLDAIAAQVEATLEAEGAGPCLLVGHSFGGAVAARVAARGQADLGGLALLAPAGLDAEINGAFVEGVLRATQPASLAPWLSLLVQDPALITPTFVEATRLARQDTGLTAAMQGFAAQFFPEGTQAFSIRADLASLRLPVRVIFGRDDRILPFRSAAALPDHVALHAFGSCGHLPHLERPEAVHTILSDMRRAFG